MKKLNRVLSLDLINEKDLEIDAKSTELALGLISGVLLMAKDSSKVTSFFEC